MIVALLETSEAEGCSRGLLSKETNKTGRSVLHAIYGHVGLVLSGRLCISMLVNVAIIIVVSFLSALTLFPYSKSCQPHVRSFGIMNS